MPQIFIIRRVSLLCAALLFANSVAALAAPVVKLSVALKAEPFAFADVRLLDGPFKHSEDLDHDYLLKLEPDRMLSWYRKESGLKPKAAVYGGWDSAGVAGCIAGHYLSACSGMYQATGDEKLRDRVNYMVDELALCQDANSNGYVAAIPDGKRIFSEIDHGIVTSKGFDLNGGWVPFYTMHKELAGLRDAYRLCGNARALEVEKKLADFIDRTLRVINHEQMQKILACEHGGMNEALADLYADTGDEKYLKLSRRFYHEVVLVPLTQQIDQLDGLHANTQIPKLIGLADLYELTGDTNDYRAASFFWKRITQHHSYVTGGNGLGEHLGEPDHLNDRLGENTTETCNVYNMLKLTRHVFEWNADPAAADFYERALFNDILSSQNPEDGRVTYNLSLAMGGKKDYQTQFNSFTCCVGTGMENHARHGAGIYFHTDDSLFVNLFIASELIWKEKGVHLRQETKFPDEDTSALIFQCDQPQLLTLHIRHPYWVKNGFAVAVNGQPVQIKSVASGYEDITRKWKTGDRVEITVPRSLHLQAMPDNPDRVAIMYGPLVLAGDLGPEKDPNAGKQYYVPVLLVKDRPLTDWLKPVAGKPGVFRTENIGRPRDVELSPFFRVYDQHYSIYWDVFTPAQWQAKQAAYEMELEKQRQLEARTVDFFQPGEQQPEQDHNLQGEHTSSGDANGHKWRHATDGGWFAFELKVDVAKTNLLQLTYWGGETGDRVFDILVDGQKIASQKLLQDKPGQFFDVTYPLPPTLTRDKEKVVVRLQAQLGAWAGRLFGARILRPNEFHFGGKSKPFDDPIWHGAADPCPVWNEAEGRVFVYYTARRAGLSSGKGVEWVFGSSIGIASTADGANWKYEGIAQGDAQLSDAERDKVTWWAPHVLRDGDTYHMFVTWIDGIYDNWAGKTAIKHFTSANGRIWTYQDTINTGSDGCIDPGICKVGDRWWMWFKDQKPDHTIWTASSSDLKTWKMEGPAFAGAHDPKNYEAPFVFVWRGQYWLLVDTMVNGCDVYKSKTARLDWQPAGHLSGAHMGVLDVGDRRFLTRHRGLEKDETSAVEKRNQQSVIDLMEIDVNQGDLVQKW